MVFGEERKGEIKEVCEYWFGIIGGVKIGFF